MSLREQGFTALAEGADVTLESPVMVGGLRVPRNMMGHTLQVLRGEYEAPGVEFESPPVVLDVGACCGAFAMWASKRWPGASITCYEPNPEALGYLRENARGRDWAVLNAAVAVGGPLMLFRGRNNLGEASLFDIGEQEFGEPGKHVQAIAADTLPMCDVLKVDTEGNEVYVIKGALSLALPKVVCFEWHRAADRDRLHVFLRERGYVLARGTVARSDRGTFVFIRSV